MNILFVYSRILHPERGGVERVTDLLAKELARRGHRIFYLHNPGDGIVETNQMATVHERRIAEDNAAEVDGQKAVSV